VSDARTRSRPTVLWATLLLSLLAHAVTLGGSWLHMPKQDLAPPPLMARLEPAAPVVTPPPPRTTAKPAPKPIAKRPTVVAAAPPTLHTDVPASWTLSAIEAMARVDDEPSEAMTQPEAPSPTPEPVVLADAAPSTFAPEPAIIKTLPRRGRIHYEVNYYLSNLPTLVGRTVQTWEAADTHYTLESYSETVGLARFTRFGPRTYRSRGAVTDHGLQPETFSTKVVIRGKTDDAVAQFDWRNHALQFGEGDAPKQAALPAGSQDLLSFIYQFSLAPPPRGRLTMPITTGTRFESYDIDVLDEETIETPLGALRALPIKQVRRPGRESIDVWLAAEYRYLPVRILVTNRDGTPGGEQVATEISIGEK